MKRKASFIGRVTEGIKFVIKRTCSFFYVRTNMVFHNTFTKEELEGIIERISAELGREKDLINSIDLLESITSSENYDLEEIQQHDFQWMKNEMSEYFTCLKEMKNEAEKKCGTLSSGETVKYPCNLKFLLRTFQESMNYILCQLTEIMEYCNIPVEMVMGNVAETDDA